MRPLALLRSNSTNYISALKSLKTVSALQKKRWGILLLFIAAIAVILAGFLLDLEPDVSNRLKGLGTVMIFFVVMPLFLLVESPGKRMKDYMLTEENIRKMQSDKKDPTQVNGAD